MKKTFLLILLSFLVSACKGQDKKLDNSVPLFGNIDESRLDSSISTILKLLPDSTLPDLSRIRKHYKLTKYKAEWVIADQQQKLDTLLFYILRCEEHGIPSATLNADTLVLLNRKLKNNDLTYSEIACLDIMANEAFIRYTRALSFGLFSPKKICPNYYYNTQEPDSTFINECFIVQKSGLDRFLAAIQTQSAEYLALQNERKKLLQLTDGDTIPIPLLKDKETIKAGKSHPVIAAIEQKLKAKGYLPANYINPQKSELNKFTLKALNRFWYKTGLKPDNEIGNYTIKELNKSPKDYLKQIDVNLERLRWKATRLPGRKYIHVNVADMRLKAYRNDTAALSMKVCVGKAPENKTPFLQSSINQIILNPTWSVPKSIVVKEISKIAVRDTSYLRRHKIRVYRNGAEVNPSSADWAKVSEKFQPYKLIQDSGQINSLGRIKFNFPNKFSVYLHDTNVKSAFQRHGRAVSHGCVRVEKPLDLAYYCLPDINPKNEQIKEYRDLYQDKIRYSIRMKPVGKKGLELLKSDPQQLKTGNIGLNPSVPIFIDYFTCFTDNTGQVVYRNDVYDLDKYIDQALQHKYPVNLCD
jgi:murein L,D-transpeptidase YcbB/YkuD